MTAKPETTVIITVSGEDYTLDCSEFTARECGVLKRIGHIRGLTEIQSALEAGDLEAVVALAVIAMKRAGAVANPEALLDGKLGNIVLKLPEGDADDPTSAPEVAALNQTSTPAECGIPS